MRPEILFPLFSSITTLKGVGPRFAPLVEKLAGPIVRDLLFMAPSGVVERPRATTATARDGVVQTFDVAIEKHVKAPRAGAPYRIRAFDGDGWLTLVWFKGGGAHLERLAPEGSRRVVSGKVERYGSEIQMAHPDYVVAPERASEIPAVEPVYPATAGVTSRTIRRFVLAALERAPDLPEWDDEAWLARNRWPSWRDALFAMHAPRSAADVDLDAPARRRLAFDELLAHQLAMGRRRLERTRAPAPVLAPGEASKRVEAALPFSLTGAQRRSIAEIRADLASGGRMSRLLQGDVGSGKTAVALLAMADAASSARQAAMMAPTEILVRQHFERSAPILDAAGIRATILTGRDKGKARTAKLDDVAAGRVDVVFGTHALFQEDVTFHALALAVVDEQHRFGVGERKRLQDKGSGVHVLSMSATPIPRTLELTQYGDLDASRLDEKPPGRRPVTTRVLPVARLPEVADRLDAAVKTGAQAYWICPLVAESEAADLAAAEARVQDLRARLTASVGLVHGQMPAAERDAVMSEFAGGRLAVLVATTVVEVGVDVPAATIMVIEQAERFGLAQLHQLRGRVGRGTADSACILLYAGRLSDAARARLDTLRSTEDGFLIAEKDWELRGGGDLLGLKQSGFPDYRLADPLAHRDLLYAAADDARLVLGRDPDLQGERGRRLRLLGHLFDWRADRSNAPA